MSSGPRRHFARLVARLDAVVLRLDRRDAASDAKDKVTAKGKHVANETADATDDAAHDLADTVGDAAQDTANKVD